MAIFEKVINRPEQAVILCGGLGTRMMPHTKKIPKPMVLCNSKPFLWYILEQLHTQGISRFVLLTGYLSEKIFNYFGDGSHWGWDIEYSNGPVDWDTGKRIWEARSKIDDIFLMLYSDNFALFQLNKVLAFHEKNKKPLTFMVAPKIKGNLSLDESGIVNHYDNSRSDSRLNYVEIGYMIIEKYKTFDFFDSPECNFSLILEKMASQMQINAFIQYDSYQSISDPIRWKKTEKYLEQKKIILIDRDGVINKKAPKGEYISRWEDFEWIQSTLEGMKILACDGFKFIVITNQAGIARGMVSPIELEKIHRNMKIELKKLGVDIIDIYLCPHHWNDSCSCRKPNPGMFFKAAKDHCLRLDRTLYIGDDPRDFEAAMNAGTKCVIISEEKIDVEHKDHLFSLKSYNSFEDAMDLIKAQFK